MSAARRRATEAVRRASHEPWWPLRRNRSGRWGRALASAGTSQRSRRRHLCDPRRRARFRTQPRVRDLAYCRAPRAVYGPGSSAEFARGMLRAPSTDRGVDDDTRAARRPRLAARPAPLELARRRCRSIGDRARVEGPAAAVGPLVPPDVLVPRELPGGPRPRLHRPLLAARRRRPRSVLRPRDDAAPGLRRGPDRRRQRPQPVRPPADRGQGRAGDAGRGPRPGSRPSASLGRRCRPSWLGARRSRRRGSGERSSRAPAAGAGRPPASSPSRARSRVAFHPRTLAQLLFVRTTLDLDRPTDRFLAAALTGILHGKSASYLSELMPNTFSMAPRYVRDFAARTAFSSPERDVFDWPRAEARPALPRAAAARRPGSRCSATPATRRRAPGPRSGPAACPTGPGSS